ncbi:EG45-like domain containing protein 2 isoform X1 [Arabidopsis lyrata subsp. lyrata]|nr:EG45-like domain containing protein 2 isoform X1 [Arabidopsis lyrata subsp. lyrata]|eukprot:XP_020888691.1 EG45-like domain containing protein 2 isoform X1 [Arabidopsis lyrata subsp. lyrata]
MIKVVVKFVVMMIVFAQILAPIAEAALGKAVYYDPPYTRSACYGTQRETMVVGVKNNLWQNGRACGRRYRVRCIGATYNFPGACTGRTVDVKVVDFCREPCNGDLNLSRDAFRVIANIDAGNIRVVYTPI